MERYNQHLNQTFHFRLDVLFFKVAGLVRFSGSPRTGCRYLSLNHPDKWFWM